MKDTQPVLIISTGRTGTIFFSRLFADLYPATASYHERGASRLIQILTNAHFAHLFPKSGLKIAWKLFKGREIRDCKKTFHIDANSFLYGLASLAPELYPGLRVLHIVRDPRTYVTSHLNFQLQRNTSFIANRFVPFWQPDPFLTGKLGWRHMPGLSRFERFCWIWDFKNSIMEQLDGSSTPYLRVRFEDIFYTPNPEEFFGRITDFIGLPRLTGIRDRFREPANTSAKTVFPDWHAWTPRQCAQLDKLCGERMRRYGYGGEAQWDQKVEAAKKDAELPS